MTSTIRADLNEVCDILEQMSETMDYRIPHTIVTKAGRAVFVKDMAGLMARVSSHARALADSGREERALVFLRGLVTNFRDEGILTNTHLGRSLEILSLVVRGIEGEDIVPDASEAGP